MVQVINLGPSRGQLQAEILGQGANQLGQGLGEFTGNYLAGKALDELANDPNLKDAPLSERWAAAQSKMAKYGERGQRLLQQRLQIEQQRQQEQAFNKIKGLDTSKMKPQEVVASMYEALQNHPRAGEIIAASLPYIMNQKATEDKAGNIDINATGMPNEGSAPVNVQAPRNIQPASGMPYSNVVQEPAKDTPEARTPIPKGKMNANDISNLSNELLNDIRPDLLSNTSYGAIPSFNFESKSDLRPEEEAQIRQRLNEKKVLPQVQEEIVDRIRQDVQTRYNEAKERYGFNEDQRRAIQDKWSNFRNLAEGERGLLTPFISQFTQANGEPLLNTQNDLRDKYFQYASDLPVNLTPEQMHAQATSLLQNDINSLQALQQSPSAPPFRGLNDMKEYLDNYARAAKPLIDKGMIGSVKDDAYFNKDLGVEETHEAIWGDQTSKPLINSIASIPFPRKNHGRPGFADQKDVNRYVNDVAKKLKGANPEDDLVLLRSAVIQNDPSNPNQALKLFTSALDQAQRDGLKLSPFQMQQLQEVRLPREPAMWEFFTSDGYKKAFNMIRGKK